MTPKAMNTDPFELRQPCNSWTFWGGLGERSTRLPPHTGLWGWGAPEFPRYYLGSLFGVSDCKAEGPSFMNQGTTILPEDCQN